MNWFRKILTGISYATAAASPIVAASGVGMPIAIGLGALSGLSATWLHFLDSPKTPQDVLDAAKQSIALANAVKQAAGK